MTNKALAILLPFVILGAPLFAGEQPQASSSLKAGDRVRVRASMLRTEAVGQVVEAAPDVLKIRLPDRPDPIEVPLARVTRLQRSLGQHTDAGKGAGVGALIGASAGVAVVAIAAASEGGCEGSCAPWAFLFGAAGGGAGALVGAVVGSNESERWEAISVGRVGVSVVPERRGAGLALSVKF